MNQKKKQSTDPRKWLWLVLTVAAICLCVLIMFSSGQGEGSVQIPIEETKTLVESTADTQVNSTASVTESVENTSPSIIMLDDGLEITSMGSYTGIYMEDGSDELVSDVMYLTVTNRGEEDIEYAEFTAQSAEHTYSFSVSTLPVGMGAVLLEKERKPYDADQRYVVTAEKVAHYQYPLELHEDLLAFQILDGAINVINQSDDDIEDDIVIYYKNYSNDLLYGGITYRIRLEGGLQAGEVRQIMAKHFSDTGSRIMFVTIG